MILFCGIPSEPPLKLAIEAAARQNLPYVVFNQRDSLDTDICLEINGGRVSGVLRVRGVDWPLEGFTGIYPRLMAYQELPEYAASGKNGHETAGSTSAAQKKIAALHESLSDWLEIAPCVVMNRASAAASNMSKPYQAQAILRAGFQTPVTLVSNDPDEVRLFCREEKQVIYKSISSERSIVSRLYGPKVQELNKIRLLPTQFQAYVKGVDVRVHVVGDEVFACEVCSEAVDYRYAFREGMQAGLAPIELPEEVAARCVRLAKMLDLPLCGIDLKRSPAGEYNTCFEVNPSPGYSYYQENTGQDIAGAMVRYLSRAGAEKP